MDESAALPGRSYFGLPFTTVGCSSDINPRGDNPCMIWHNTTVAQRGFMLSLRNDLDASYVADVVRHMAASVEAGRPFVDASQPAASQWKAEVTQCPGQPCVTVAGPAVPSRRTEVTQ